MGPNPWWGAGPRRDDDGHEDERLSALLDDELHEDEALDVIRHVAHCEHCEFALARIRRVREAVRSLPAVTPPPWLFDDVAARVDGQPPLPLRRRLALAGVAAVGLFGTVAFVAGGSTDGTVNPPIETFVVDHVARFGGGPVITPVDLGR